MSSTSANSTHDVDVATSTHPTSTITTPASESSATDTHPPSDLSNTLSLDSRWDTGSNSWNYTETTNPNIPAEQVLPMGAETTNSDWKKYRFVVVRKYEKPFNDSKEKISFEIFLMDLHLVEACQNVMADVRGVSWKSQPIKLNPKVLISNFPRLEKYEQNLMARTERTDAEDLMLKSLSVLLAYMRTHYEYTLARITNLVKNSEITFELLYTILLPGTVIVHFCPITGEPRAMKLLAAYEHRPFNGQAFWNLQCEYMECTMGEDGGEDKGKQPIRFGMLDAEVQIPHFEGTEKISSLKAYPMEFHPDPAALKAKLLERAHTWVSLCGVHHVYYEGGAGRYEFVSDKLKLMRYSVRSRIMVDKASFSRIDADYRIPYPDRMLPSRPNSKNGVYGLTDPELLLAPSLVYGFSLTDKVWLEFNVNRATRIHWNDKAFDGLVLPKERKALLRGLIKAYSEPEIEAGPTPFDDFVHGKGQGLIVNLFGPPGVGKTLSAEATSETLHRPLYIVGSGELGTNAGALEDALRKAFELAAVWHAVLLIDEADVFLEQRSLHDLERNAMVAGFLRLLEYYPGILFLTTNRIQAFDEAFLSRIHVSLHFDELSVQTKMDIWRAFLHKAGLDEGKTEEGLLSRLAEHNINGRQIKNACRTATSLAASRDEKIQYKHLEEVLGMMEEFVKDFSREQKIPRLLETREEATRPKSESSRWMKQFLCRLNKYLARFRSV